MGSASRSAHPRPLVALTVGDPAGIGPEVALAALRDPRVRERMALLLLGPGGLRPDEVPLVDPIQKGSAALPGLGWIETAGPSIWRMGEAQAECGRAAIAALRAGHDLAVDGRVDALVTGPVNKQALHLAGEQVEGQTELLARWCKVTRYEMIGVAGSLRVMLLTRHMPLRRALEAITTERVVDHLALFHESLHRFGVDSARLALAGLNPHAGESGILGEEEDAILRPAVQAARARGIDVSGPLSPDTVFLLASQGEFDGVLALYHDQAFIPIKLLSRDGGVTVIAGLPYLRVSPVHGTAFDIAGRGIASPANLIAALLQASEWSPRAVAGGRGRARSGQSTSGSG
jgi:4-hydroxythreonine-4-phosphate dehydrogenase